MRIAWFTPFSVRSAIAEFSRHIVDALAEYADVTLWTVSGDEAMRPTRLRREDAARAVDRIDLLDDYDVVVYNFGNHHRYHGPIVDVARNRSGIVLLHDRTYRNLFEDYWRDRGSAATYVAKMEKHYGAPGRDAAVATGLQTAAAKAASFPLVEEALGNAEGVVVHSHSHAESIRLAWAGPLATLFLPSYPTDWQVEPRSSSRRDDDRALLLTVGHVNPNKQIHVVVDALTADPELARKVRYVIVGSHDENSPYFRDLQARVRDAGAEVRIDFRGYEPDDVLAALAREADVFVNLRYPNSEGSSASLMRQLPYGIPVLSYTSGVFSEVPEGILTRVDRLDGESVGRELRRLVNYPNRRALIGDRGREWARSLRPDLYARRFLEFVSSDVRPARPLLALADRVALELGSFGVDTRLRVIDHVAAELATLLPKPEPAGTTFRTLDARDLDALATFLERNDVAAVSSTFDPFPMTRRTAEELLLPTSGDRFYGAFSSENLIAFSMLRGWDQGYEIPSFGIVVDSAAQRRGLGRRFTEWTVEQARSLECPAVRLSVYADNEPAYAIYRQLGFLEHERHTVERSGREDTQIVMLKTF